MGSAKRGKFLTLFFKWNTIEITSISGSSSARLMPNILGTEYTWKPLTSLFPILVLPTRSFTHTQVCSHPAHPSSTPILCPHHPSKQLPLGHCQACRCAYRQHGLPSGGQCPGEKPAHTDPTRDLGLSGQGRPGSLVCRTWSRRGDVWARWVHPRDPMDSCPTERTQLEKGLRRAPYTWFSGQGLSCLTVNSFASALPFQSQ